MALHKDSEGYWINPGGSMPDGAFGQYAKENAQKLAGEFVYAYGWTIDAVCGFFSAITYESAFDPTKIEGNLSEPTKNSGVGYVQWTPSAQLISYCNTWSVDWRLTSSQLRKLELERTTTDSDIKQWFVMNPYYALYMEHFTKEPPATFMEYSKSTLQEYSMLELCAMIPEFYTRPASWDDTSKWYRNEEAGNFWYEYLTGEAPPTPPTPVTPVKHKLPVYMMCKKYFL